MALHMLLVKRSSLHNENSYACVPKNTRHGNAPLATTWRGFATGHVDEAFKDWSSKPIGSASIGQALGIPTRDSPFSMGTEMDGGKWKATTAACSSLHTSSLGLARVEK